MHVLDALKKIACFASENTVVIASDKRVNTLPVQRTVEPKVIVSLSLTKARARAGELFINWFSEIYGRARCALSLARSTLGVFILRKKKILVEDEDTV